MNYGKRNDEKDDFEKSCGSSENVFCEDLRQRQEAEGELRRERPERKSA